MPSAQPAPDEFTCPRCGGNACRRIELPNPLLIHWILNPAMAVNELALGQRLPRTTYICITCDRPLYQRQFVKCRDCGEFHDGMLWGNRNGFGHWFGLVCPSCGGTIASLMNVWSVALAVLLAPLWLPIWRLTRESYVARERRRGAASLAALASMTDAQRARPPIAGWAAAIRMTLLFAAMLWAIVVGTVWFQNPAMPSFALVLLVLGAVPLSILGGILIYGTVVLVVYVVSGRPQRRPGRCRNCGYRLRGLTSDRCPECGYRVPAGDREQPSETAERL